MGVLLFLLGALKVIGIILLTVLLLILFLLTIVVSTPIKYKIKVEKLDQLIGMVRITYLFGLVRIILKYDDFGLKYKIKIFFKKYNKGINLKDKEKKDDTKQEAVEQGVVKQKEIKRHSVNKDSKIAENENDSEIKIKNQSEKNIENKTIEEDKKFKKDKEIKKIKEVKEHKKVKKSKEKNKTKKNKEEKEQETNLIKKIKIIRDLPYIDDMIKNIKTFLKKFFKHVLPRKLFVVGQIGMEDPAGTGYIFGFLGIINSFLGKNIKMNIKGNFEEEVLIGKLYAEGKIRICYLLYISIILLIKKSTRRFIKFIRAEF